MENSILSDIKALRNIEDDNYAYDRELVSDINSAISKLWQLGIGPDEGFVITGTSETWADLAGDDKRLNLIKSYVEKDVQLKFDPPSNGFLVTMIQEELKELTWRIQVVADKK